jgi:hypothetical protein
VPVIGRPGAKNRMPRVPGWLRHWAYYASAGCTVKRMLPGWTIQSSLTPMSHAMSIPVRRFLCAAPPLMKGPCSFAASV